MSVAITTQTVSSINVTSETERAQSFATSRPFDTATQSLTTLFKRIQESSSLKDKKVAALQLHHEITFLRNASLQDRREVLAANQHLSKKELENLERTELQRGKIMEAYIDALMQQATELLDTEVALQLSFHSQGKRSEIIPFYDAAQKVFAITTPQTAFERDWDFAKCLCEEGLLSESIALIKKVPLPDDVRKLFDSIKVSPTQEKLAQFFQVAECAEIKKHIKTVSDELYRPKTLADVLSQSTILKVFLKYVDPVKLMCLNSSYHEAVQQKLSKAYVEKHAQKACDLRGFSLVSAPIACRNLLSTAVVALCQNGLEYKNLDPGLQNDVGIAKIALISITQKGSAADFERLVALFPEHIKRKLPEYLNDIKKTSTRASGKILFEEKHVRQPTVEFLTEALINKFPKDKDICRIMVQISGCLLQHASTVLQKDPEIVQLAVQNNGMALHFASAQLKDTDEIVMAAITQDGFALLYASNRLKDTEAFVMTAVTHNRRIMRSGHALHYANDRWKDNEAIVMAAVSNQALALSYASGRLKDSTDFIKIAVSQNWNALRYTSKRIKDSKEIIGLAVSQNGASLYYASDRLKDNENIVMMAVRNNGCSLKYASKELKGLKRVVLAAVSQDGGALKIASQPLQDNDEVVSVAVSNNGCALDYASKRLRDTDAIVMAAVTENGKALEYASERLQDNEDIVMTAVSKAGCIVSYASKRLKDNEAIVRAAVAQNRGALQYASDRLRALLMA